MAHKAEPKPNEDDECPFCRDSLRKPRRAFIKHVASHMEKIALMALRSVRFEDRLAINREGSMETSRLPASNDFTQNHFPCNLISASSSRVFDSSSDEMVERQMNQVFRQKAPDPDLTSGLHSAFHGSDIGLQTPGQTQYAPAHNSCSVDTPISSPAPSDTKPSKNRTELRAHIIKPFTKFPCPIVGCKRNEERGGFIYKENLEKHLRNEHGDIPALASSHAKASGISSTAA